MYQRPSRSTKAVNSFRMVLTLFYSESSLLLLWLTDLDSRGDACGEQARPPCPPPAEAACYTALPKYLLNNSSALRAPSSERTTDLAFDLGSAMNPWPCSRF